MIKYGNIWTLLGLDVARSDWNSWLLSSTDEPASAIELAQSDDPATLSFLSNELLPAAALEAGVAMETVVIVAIGVLATIFLASFVALVMVCRHRYRYPHHQLHPFDTKSVNQYQASPPHGLADKM